MAQAPKARKESIREIIPDDMLGARRMVEELAKEFPDDITVFELVDNVYEDTFDDDNYESGEIEKNKKRLTAIERLIELNPDDALNVYDDKDSYPLGLYYAKFSLICEILEQGEFSLDLTQSAIEAIDKAIALAQSDKKRNLQFLFADKWFALSLVLPNYKKKSDAYQQLKKIIQEGYASLIARDDLATILYKPEDTLVLAAAFFQEICSDWQHCAEAYRRVLEFAPKESSSHLGLAEAQVKLGDYQDGLNTLAKIPANDKYNYIHERWLIAAKAHLGLGEQDKAVEMIEKYSEGKSSRLGKVARDKDLKPLRDHEGFRALAGEFLKK
jgi:hypothetical protein